MGSLPFKYLGLLMHHKRLSNTDWKIIKEKVERKLRSWKGKYMSIRGKLVLINSILTSLTMFSYHFSKSLKEFLKVKIFLTK